ncbi:BQ5605_C014g07546 [Microbotryum silenes-dioicae]|uniref:BQ5605_C014g07546 protein n=1 Tax=Microbotryum silenes-dioicae TaxID=796604 RepID=A0A2X0NRJ9_9BASI|nr:BQ5605_C014g07546 [Microbotryum silenes-dioicae]
MTPHPRPHVHPPSEDDPEEEEEDDDNDTGRISLSTATTTHDLAVRGGREDEDRWDPLDLQDDPSFEGLLTRPGQTSTPQKARGMNKGLFDQDEEPSSEADDWLRGDGIRLTRQRLANLPLVDAEAQQRTHSSTSITNTRIARGASSPIYAPSPSTGSSTLVDPREDEIDLIMARRRLKEKARAGREQGEEVTIRHGNGVTTLREEAEDEEEEARTEIAAPRTRPNNEHDHRSPSPPRPFSNPTPRRRGAPLESYLQSHTTPRYTTSRTSPLPTATPLAPGSFPPIPSRTPLPPSQLSSTPLPRHTGRAQILDAFNRFIQGPNGALTLSAERRAALTRKNVRAEAEAREVLMRSKTSSVGSSQLKRSNSTMRTVKGTPHPTGWYAFEPRAIETGDTEASSPNVRNGRGEAQDREAQPKSKPFTNTRFKRQDFVEDEGDRSRERNSRTQGYEGDDSAPEEEDDVEQEEGEEEEAVYRATGGGRSAIEYAMAKSFIASPVKTKPRVNSPPRSTIPPRPMTPPSPTPPELPPMPPTPSPQSSPTARRRRVPLTTQTNSSSSAAATPSFRSLTKKVLPQSSTPPRSPPPLPRTTHPDHPRSSTPPRSTRFIPPSPSRTPLSKRSSTTPPSKKPTPKLPFVSPSKSPVNSPPPRVTYQVQERSFRNEKEEQEQIDPSRDDDQHLLELVEELARIVRSRSIESSREESGENLDEGARGFYGEEDAALLRRNEDVLREAEECVREGRDLEVVLRGEEREGKMNEATIQTLLQRLDEAETIDESLLSRMDALRSTLDTLGRDLGAQVSLAVQTKLEEEASQRGNWLMWGVACQFVLIWVVMCLANYRASRLYDSSFIDPFTHPALYYISPSTTTHHISEETLALFSPVPIRGRGVGQRGLNYVLLVMRRLVGGIGRGEKGFGFGMGGMGKGRGVVERVPF